MFRAVPWFVMCVIGLSLTVPAGCSRDGTPQQPVTRQQQKLTICQGGILAVLPAVAKENGYFAAEGLDVTVSLIGDGKAAMGAFLDGTCEAALTGEYPLARQSFERSDLAIIATLSSSDNAVKVLARSDRGLASPRDLVGKRVGVSKGTISNFFLDQFLKKNRIPRERLQIVDMSHRDLPKALQRGDVDAYAGSDVAYLAGKQAVGAAGVTFAEPGLTNHAACLTVKKEWLAAHQDGARALLRALVRAEEELARRPEELAGLLARQLNIPVADLKVLMTEQHSSVALDQVLLLALEDEARWMQETGIVTGKPFPNHLHLLEPAPLRSVAPEAVRLK
jgi:NitT/TauT family transport system substrate-binding protein